MGRTLILGSGGMLGSAFVSVHGPSGLATAGRAELQRAGLEAIIRAYSPKLVINCAAHTNVEAAEQDSSEADVVNAILPARIGAACREAEAVLVHFSSTGVYGSWKATPYSENDQPKPTTAHHRSKLEGEVAVRQSGCDHLIVRTGWLFGGEPGGAKNFVWNRMVEAAAKQQIVSDPFQHGCPTAVDDVARQVLATVEARVRGLVNVVSGGSVSRFGYVDRIVRAAGLPCRVEASTVPFKRLAPVSLNETAVNDRLRSLGLDSMPPWEQAVDRYVAALIGSRIWRAVREVRA